MLNAFRHHWNLHPNSSLRGRLCQRKCSTPFGIIGIFTASSTSPSTKSHGRAQRLSASLESSLLRPTRRRLGDGCSTPFGIIGIFTLVVLLTFGIAYLRCSTPFGIIGIFTLRPGCFRQTRLPRAQRLSASLESSLDDFSTWTYQVIACSTPFGIIGIFTRK